MLKVTNLRKKFDTFCLDNVTFCVPTGSIVGFVGQNGAGKTTTLKCIMRTMLPDGGAVTVMGNDMATHEEQNKHLVSYTVGAFDYYRHHRLADVAKVYASFYTTWNDDLFKGYCQKFNLQLTKRIKELSAGMKVKFALALAMSHEAKLFIFDEPTSGLDPIARDELLDVFADLVQDGDKSILFSTHITSDLEKCADYIVFIHNGRILVDSPKDKLLDDHALVKGGLEELDDQLKARLIGLKTHQFGYTALIRRKDIRPNDTFVTEKPTIDDVMIHFNKEARNNG